MKSPLASKFRVTETTIELLDPHITKQDFIHATLEYAELISASTFKQGDLLNLFREHYPSDLHKELIPKLVAKTNTKKQTFENQMSTSKHILAHERSDRISPSHYAELQPLQDQSERGKLIEKLISEISAGRKISLQELRKLVRTAKLRTGQAITKVGPKRKLPNAQ